MTKIVIISTKEDSKELWPKDLPSCAGFKYIRDGRTRRIKVREIWVNRTYLTRFGFFVAFVHEVGHWVLSFLPEKVHEFLDTLYEKAWNPVSAFLDVKLGMIYSNG